MGRQRENSGAHNWCRNADYSMQLTSRCRAHGSFKRKLQKQGEKIAWNGISETLNQGLWQCVCWKTSGLICHANVFAVPLPLSFPSELIQSSCIVCLGARHAIYC